MKSNTIKIKMLLFQRPALFGAAAILAQTGLAQTWQTVDDFQYAAGKAAVAVGLAKDPSGTIYAAGWAKDTNGTMHALTMKSADAGATWSNPVDDFLYPGSLPTVDVAIVSDSAGNLYSAGYAFVNGISARWLVRRSQDHGVTWSTMDDFTLGGTVAQCHALTTDVSGNIYAVGYGTMAQSSTTFYWTVRKGTANQDGSMSWSTVDTFSPSGSGNAMGVFCHPTAGIFVAGNAKSSGTTPYNIWVVRRSRDSGATWATVDAYQLDSTQGSTAKSIAADAAGNLYVVGPATKSGYNHSIIRKSTNGGSVWKTADDFHPTATEDEFPEQISADPRGNLYVIGCSRISYVQHWLVRKNPGAVGAWQTVDDFNYAPNKNADAYGIATDNAGNVFVAGYGLDATNVQHWLVRRLAP